MADSDIKLKHKVQLRKKVEEPAVTDETEGAESGHTPMPQTPNSNKWIWIVLGVVAVGVIFYFIFSNSGDTSVTRPVQEIESIDETIIPTDSVSDKGYAQDEANPPAEGTVVAEPESSSVETPATTPEVATTTTPSANIPALDNVEAEALKVIQGDYGVGQERKNKLGTQYQAVQNRVNELKREGVF